MTDLPPRRAVRQALAILVAGALTACRPAPATPSPSTAFRGPTEPIPPGSRGDPDATRSLVLLGTPGAMWLAWLDGQPRVPPDVPDRDVRWIAGDSSDGLVATVGPTGRIYVSGPIPAGTQPSWRELSVDDATRRWLGDPLADAVGDPGSATIVAVAADPAAGGSDGHLVVLDRSGGPTRIVALAGRWDGRAPAWIGSGRLAVSTRGTADDTALTIVDLAGGGSQLWGSAIGAFAISGDGATLAYQDRSDGRILVGAFDPTRVLTDFVPLAAGGPARVAAQLLLDRTGRHLAVAWLDDTGDTTALAVYEREADRWSLVREEPVPRGTSRAVLVSLGP